MQNEEFLGLVGNLAHSIHNEDTFKKIRNLLAEVKSTKNRREFLAPLPNQGVKPLAQFALANSWGI